MLLSLLKNIYVHFKKKKPRTGLFNKEVAVVQDTAVTYNVIINMCNSWLAF